MNNNNKLTYNRLFFLLCIITIFFFLSLIIFIMNNNYEIFHKYIIKLWEIDYDPLDLVNQKKEIENNKSYIKIINYRAPIFEINIWYLIGKGLNTWSNYFNYHNLFLNEIEENIFERDEYAKKINEMEYFVYNENIPTNKAFLKHHFKNEELINNIIFQESIYQTNKSIHLSPSDVFFRFPERNSRMNKLEYTLSNFPYNIFYYIGRYPFGSEWLTAHHSFSNGYLTGVSKLQNNYQQLFIEFENKSKINNMIEIENYFKQYDKKFTTYIQEKYKNTNLIYHIPKVQINHLMQLNYQEIQYILHLIQDTTYYKNRTFMDVHWEIFNGHSTLLSTKIDMQKTTLSTFSNDHHTNFLTNYLIRENIKTPTGFYNPFHMNFPGIIESNKIQKKYYFTEETLCLLPIHLLIKLNDHVINDQIFVTNIYERARSNNFWNLLSNSGNTFVERLFKYTEYGKYSPTTIFFFSNNIEHIETPYQKNFFLSHNPWWDSLTPSTQQKLYNLLSELEDDEINNLFFKIIDRFFENEAFLSIEEIERLLPKTSENNIIDVMRLHDGSLFPRQKNLTTFFGIIIKIDYD